MNEALLEGIKQAPWAAALVAIVYLFLRAEKERSERAIENAKDISLNQRNNEIERNKLLSDMFKSIIENSNSDNASILKALDDLKFTVIDQYEKLGVTRDLMRAAKRGET
jgi:hypothetical protein